MKIRKFIPAFIISLLSLTLLGAKFAAATSDRDYEIGILPVSNKIEIAQGETYIGKVTVANMGLKEFDYEMEIKPFGISDSSYLNVNFEENEYTSIVGWTTLSKTTGHLTPGTHEEIEYTITVPEKAFAGGQYFAVAASITNSIEDEAGFSLTGSVASIVYTTISGDATNSGEITENSIPPFYFNGPIKLNSTVTNTGDVHNTATYTVEISNAFTGEVAYTNSDAPLTHIILPKTERTESTTWDAPLFGIFKVKQTIEYASETSITENTVIICPIWLIATVVALIAIIVLKIVFTVKKHRKEKIF